MFSAYCKFQLLSLLFVGSYALRVAYRDGDVLPNPLQSTTRKTRARSSRQFGLLVAVDRKDINPQLFGSIRGLPGLEFRINERGFSYASLLASPIINNEIVRTRLPPSRQCFHQVNGCITMYNLFISRYRCPQLVSVYPTPPNRLLITLRNLDFEITGNLGGEIEVILPITVNGIVHIRAHQVSVTSQLTLHRGSDGSPYVRVIGCYVSVGFTDVVVQNGGLVGDVFNSQFRGTAAEQVRRAIPARICTMIPDIVRKKLNTRLHAMPTTIPFDKFTSLGEGIIRSIKVADLPQHCSTPLCQQRIQNRDSITHLSAPTATPHTPIPVSRVIQRRDAQKFAGKESAVIDPIPWNVRGDSTEIHLQPIRTVSATVIANKRSAPQTIKRTIRQISAAPRAHRLPSSSSTAEALRLVTLPPSPSASRINRAAETSTLDPCADCYPGNKSNTLDALSSLSKSIDMKKLADLMLSLLLLRSSATPSDFTIALSGEFSPSGRGGTPFHPFPMHFPRTRSAGTRMFEALISDYTINTLFYYMHKRGFISFRVGPETPKVGELLKTTCDEGDYDDLDDTDDEDLEEEIGSKTTTTASSQKSKKRRKREAAEEENEEKESSLVDLGVCIGDIMPAIREKYPKKLLHIKIHSTRAPSVVLSAINGGTAIISMELEAVLYIDDSGEKVGRIIISSVLEANIHASENRVIGVAEIQKLKLVDKEKTLGLPQDALDNLANLSKEVVSKMANDALSKGFVVQLPTAMLPFTFVKPRFAVVEHAVHLASDIRVSASALGITSSSICRRF